MISGPSTIYAWQEYTYTAMSSGGGTPYSHTWYVRWPWGTWEWYASGSPMTFSMGACGQLQLKLVTESPNGMVAEDEKTLSISQSPDPGGPICVESD